MIPAEIIVAFLTASVLLGLAPGPDNIFVLTQSALQGRQAGIAVTLGLCTGLVLHTCAVALGVAVLFQTSAVAFTLLKYIGAAYLLYLAWQAFRAPALNTADRRKKAAAHVKLYGRGIIMNVTNPKISIFFLAFLPQFADPAQGSVWIQILILGGLFIVVTLLLFAGIALLAGTLGHWLNRSLRTQTILSKLAGTVFLGLALKLATTRR